MKTEQKVVSLETARRLKENNFPQDTERWYMEGGTLLSADDIDSGHYHIEVDEGLFTAAPDSAELGELLPSSIEHNGGSTFLKQRKLTEGDYEIRFSSPIGEKFMRNKNEAEARAAAWLWLKENNLL